MLKIKLVSFLIAISVLGFSQATIAAEEVSSIARGGKLYDKWFKVIAVMRDSSHGYAGKMDDQDFTDLANFVTKGQIDMEVVIDRKSGKVEGDLTQGERYFNTVCAGCHAKSGKEPEDMPPLGKLANKNPWEIIQKI